MSWRCTQLLGLTMWLGTGYAAPSDARADLATMAAKLQSTRAPTG